MPDPGQYKDSSIPVTPEDLARRQRKIWSAVAAAATIVILLAAWTYKRQSAPIDALEAFNAGERSFRSAHYSQALASFDRAIGSKPDYAEAYLMRGRTNVALGNPLTAIPDFNKVMKLEPRNPEPFLDRGSIQLSLHAYDEAFADFAHAVELAPKLDTAYNLRGTVLLAVGEPARALADFNRAVELRPAMNNFFQRGATYQQLGQHDLAIKDFTRVIELDRNAPQSYLSRAQSLEALGDKAGTARDRQVARTLEGR